MISSCAVTVKLEWSEYALGSILSKLSIGSW